MKNFLPLIITLVVFFSACKNDDSITDTVEPTPSIPDFVMAGGETTIFDITSNAFATPAPNLTPANFDKHLEGDLAFEQVFVTEPADVNPGLGPIFNNNSCVSCHIKNGRSRPSLDGNELSGFLIRLSISGLGEFGGPKGVPFLGTQLQNRSVFGVEKEATFTATEIEEIVSFVDGTQVTLHKPEYSITSSQYNIPTDIMISPRVAPAVFGLGLLEEIPEEDILNKVDENDVDGDGISGKANMVWNIKEETKTLGRFGWKAENPTALQQTADAYHQDMGITNSLFSEETCFEQEDCNHNGELDITDATLDITTFYFQTLAVPAVRNYENETFQKGRVLFEEINCSSCHTPKQQTGNSSIPSLSNQTFFPYTDLLLHDMGVGLADNRPSFEANGQEWRTPPLWGIGLMPVVNGHTRLLHDGRARNVTEAILWHGGEAEQAKESFKQLSREDREALLVFINSI